MTPCSTGRHRHARWIGCLGVVVLGFGGVGRASAASEDPHVLMTGPASAIIRQAVNGAIRRLEERPSCVRLFSDFQSPDGVSLADHLAGLSVTPTQYLTALRFVDGDALSRCHVMGGPIAFTAQAHRVIYVCTNHFVSMYGRNRVYAEIVVIHELLHAAGLGENPPSSEQISRAAFARCAS
jgi:hypothetical protein